MGRQGTSGRVLAIEVRNHQDNRQHLVYLIEDGMGRRRGAEQVSKRVSW